MLSSEFSIDIILPAALCSWEVKAAVVWG